MEREGICGEMPINVGQAREVLNDLPLSNHVMLLGNDENFEAARRRICREKIHTYPRQHNHTCSLESPLTPY